MLMQPEEGSNGLKVNSSVTNGIIKSLENGTVTTVTSKPGKGKTFFMTSLFFDNLSAKKNLLMFTLETKASEVVFRLAKRNSLQFNSKPTLANYYNKNYSESELIDPLMNNEKIGKFEIIELNQENFSINFIISAIQKYNILWKDSGGCNGVFIEDFHIVKFLALDSSLSVEKDKDNYIVNMLAYTILNLSHEYGIPIVISCLSSDQSILSGLEYLNRVSEVCIKTDFSYTNSTGQPPTMDISFYKSLEPVGMRQSICNFDHYMVS